MRRDPRKYLWDALRAGGFLRQFAAGKTFEEYQDDVLLRSAVERQLEIVGEAFSQLAKRNTDLAAQIPELPRIVAFRNILIHGYASVDDTLVWQVLTEKLRSWKQSYGHYWPIWAIPTPLTKCQPASSPGIEYGTRPRSRACRGTSLSNARGRC